MPSEKDLRVELDEILNRSVNFHTVRVGEVVSSNNGMQWTAR
jgi:hypothetical protein